LFSLGSGLKIYKSSRNSLATFFHGTSYVLMLTKNELGNILGNIFKNSFGHPARCVVIRNRRIGSWSQSYDF
jgi:hypothetical protein